MNQQQRETHTHLNFLTSLVRLSAITQDESGKSVEPPREAEKLSELAAYIPVPLRS
jgi:hypothetical protein